ncbi:Uncharacterised protein [Listeria monocytogenes]|nr:gp74 [Listeria phage B054]AGR13480.1 hypothetical protein M643_02990 [Listeria monocytogenes]AAY53179.1 gp74 [Listeria phage B054]RKA44976.1 hypothetical protein DYZ93_00088 [Listeria monocytogenes]RKA87020.1 hypothetical protein AFX66_01787 [Listeria monocytogenes]RKC54411.1 hypothetical protein AF862_00687 [Listeria monocytogenes]
MKHEMTKYSMDGKRYVSSWLQVNIFGKALCFNHKSIAI